VENLSLVIFFIFGTVVGSFLNVLVLRYNTGRSLAGRSGCFSCGKKLAWYELIPVLSYLLQGGRCRGCGSRISTQYPLVELGIGALFALIAWQSWPLWSALYHLAVWSILMAITAYDIRHKIIPDGMVYILIGLSALSVLLTEVRLQSIGWRVGAALSMALFFAALWHFSAGKWMGLGDAKLALGLGLLLGPSQGFAALLLAFWIGAAFGVALLLFRGRYATIKTEVPFAPFLILGAALAAFGHIDMAAVLSFFSFSNALY